MRQLQVWAPDAQSVELVDATQASFAPQVMLTRTTVNYNGHDAIPGYWQTTPAGVNVLNEGDGYWFLVATDGGSTQFKMDPYARAMHYDTSWSIYKETDTFLWADQNHQPPPVGKMVIYQLFQGGYEGRGDGNWVDPATGANCGFTWTPNGTICPVRLPPGDRTEWSVVDCDVARPSGDAGQPRDDRRIGL